jgi:hypothetical protein
MKKMIPLLILTVIWLSGCAGQKEEAATSQDKSSSATPEQAVQDYAAALAKNDMDKVLSFYLPAAFKMDGVTEAQAKDLMESQLRSQDVPLFASNPVKIVKATRFAQVDYTVGDKTRHLLLQETPEGWKISGAMVLTE